MKPSRRLIDCYLPPKDGFILDSLVATTYQIDFDFFEEQLLATSLGVRAPVSRRWKAFRSELERCLSKCAVSVLYDLRGCDRLKRLSPRIDPIPISTRKLHAKISLLMWVRPESDGDHLMRLIVGSANLTQSGFRENYECIVSVTFGGHYRSPRDLLIKAIDIVRQIAAESKSPQLDRQLNSFQDRADKLAVGKYTDVDPRDLVLADEVLDRVSSRWSEISPAPPKKLTIASPFWPQGKTAAKALTDLADRFQTPPTVELVCRGAQSATGTEWLPEFDADLATRLQHDLKGQLFLYPALPDTGLEASGVDQAEAGDEPEEHELGRKVVSEKSPGDEIQRSLHAKMLLLDGPGGSVLYVGSSNCTRRGLNLGGATNWETGFVYRLTPKQRRQLDSLLAFRGAAIEVLPDKEPETVKPEREEDASIPSFLSAVTAKGAKVTVRFREGIARPSDLVILMKIPLQLQEDNYWVIHRQDSSCVDQPEITRELASCPRCNKDLVELASEDFSGPWIPHICVQVRWDDHCASFPVRFDDKHSLPLLLGGRNPTESELIEYFLWGREPESDDRDDCPGTEGPASKPDDPLDTRRILTYFIRRFIEAIPGIEAELQQASYSRTALEASLRGPTSPAKLAEQAFASLGKGRTQDEPEKTPTAVGFQLTEILAALLRSRAKLKDESLKKCYEPVVDHCRELIARLISDHPQLAEGAFHDYQARFVEDEA